MNHEIHEAHEKAETLAEIVAEMRKRMKSYYYSREGRNLMRQYADRIEAVARRETAAAWIEGYNHAKRYFRPLTDEICRALPNPDPDWKATCAKCHDGDIEPDCEYYGEPNGCNSPIYGEHPTAEASSVVGNAAAMYSCLLKILAEMIDLGGMAVGRKACFSPDAIADEIRQALAVPPRNCDRFDGDIDKLREACARERGLNPEEDFPDVFPDWLLTSSTERKERPMKANKHDNDFNAGFHNWMASAMAYDWYEKHGKPLPRIWKKRFDEGQAWLNGLSAEDYDRLIH